ncbi:MAG: hypothetical protein JO303_07920 [Caulobacteraceae bacterium]|nr:hypothetical protein [Caulobacteraceae bacterium]
MAAFAVRRLNRLRERLRLLGGPSPASGIEGFGRRGGHVCLMMGREDASLDEIEIFFGPKGERLKTIPGAALRVVDELDHGLALRRSRQIALEELEAWLDDHWPAPETPARDPPTRAARAQ